MRFNPHSVIRLIKKSLAVSAIVDLHLIARKRDCREQRVLRLARIQSRVLHHDRDIRFNQTRIWRVRRNALGLFEVVEAQMSRAPAWDFESIWSDRILVLEKNRDLDV